MKSRYKETKPPQKGAGLGCLPGAVSFGRE